MNAWCFLAEGSLSACSFFLLSLYSTTHHMSIVHKEGKFGVGSFTEAKVWLFGGGVLGRWQFMVVVLQDGQVPVGFSSYQCWALKADFVFLYQDPGIPSVDTKQLFSLCQHVVPLGPAATMENSRRHGWIYSLTSCEQQVSISIAANRSIGGSHRREVTCSSQKNEYWNWGKSLQSLVLLHIDSLCLEQYQDDMTLWMNLPLEAVCVQVAPKMIMEQRD